MRNLKGKWTISGVFDAAAQEFGGRTLALFLIVNAVTVAGLYVFTADRIFSFPSSIGGVLDEDFVAYMRASQMVLEGGAAQLYNAAAFRATLAPVHDSLLFLNPPHFLLLVWPLSLAPYGVAKLVWLAAIVAALASTAMIVKPKPLMLAAMMLSPAALLSLLMLQTGPFIALGLTAGLLLAGNRPMLCGFVLALMTMKPQYGILVPVFLLAAGHWRAFAAVAGFSIMLAGLSTLVFGVEVWSAFFDSLKAGAHGDHMSAVYRGMTSVHHTLGKLGADMALRTGAQIAVIGVMAIGVWFAARRWPRDAAIGFTLLAAAFAAPSVWAYDWPIVVAGIYMLRRTASPWPPGLQFAAGLLWMGPLFALVPNAMLLSLAAPASLAAVLALVFFGRTEASGNRSLRG